MLCLGRQVNEDVHLYDCEGNLLAKVKVLHCEGNKVRLGFTADRDQITILRAEVAARQEAAA